MAERITFDLGVLGRELDVAKMHAAIGQEMPFRWGDREMPSRIISVTTKDDRMKVTVEVDGELDWPDRDERGQMTAIRVKPSPPLPPEPPVVPAPPPAPPDPGAPLPPFPPVPVCRLPPPEPPVE